MVRTHAAMEARLLLRNGEQLLLALVIPLLVLVGGTLATGVLAMGSGRRIDILTPGVLALAVLSTAFTSLAIATGFERRYGVLKRLGASPLPRTGLLAGKALAVSAIEAGQLALICVVALAMGWQPQGGLVAVAAVLALVGVGTAAFASLGLTMAGALRAEATLAAANLVYVLLLAFGAILVPVASYPAGIQPVVERLPSGALAEGLRQALTGGAPPWAPLAVLAAWTAVGVALSARTFRWE
jgi:ABC-2 type transport system permease protein